MAKAVGGVYLGCMSPRVLLVIAAVAVASGCGQAASKASHAGRHTPARPNVGLIAESAAATQSAGSAKLAFDMTMTGLPSGELDMTGTGAMDFHPRRADLTFHVVTPGAGM